LGCAIITVFFIAISGVSLGDSEPNDTMQEAEMLTLGQEIFGTLDSSTDDFDYYNISFEADSDVIAKLDGPDLADYDLSIYDHNGTKMAGSSTDWDADEILIFHPTETGSYYIGIWAYDGNGSYTLVVDNPKTTSNDTYSIQDAVNNGYIKAEITGMYDGDEEVFDLKNGLEVFYGLCIKVSLTSFVDNDLDIIVPSGLMLEATDEEVEDKIITKTHTINMESLASNETEIFAMSIDMYKNIPVLSTTYTMGEMASGDILKVANYIDEHRQQTAVGQAAIWMISDNATDEELESIGATSSGIAFAKVILEDSGVTAMVIIAFILFVILSRRSPTKPAKDKGSSFGEMEPVKPAGQAPPPKADIPPPRRQPPAPPPPPPL
jgi:hypothetical protein